MRHRNFKDWMIAEKADPFGFERHLARRSPEIHKKDDEFPVDTMDPEKFLGELASYHIGIKEAKYDWASHVDWGDGESGSLRVEISPVWNKIFIRRKMNDLEGTPIWICKRIMSIYEIDFRKHEEDLAHIFHERLKKIDSELLEMPQAEFDLDRFILSLASKARRESPAILIYNGIRQTDETAYTIYFSLTGHGVEAPDARRVEQFNIDASYSPKRGTIRCFGYEISSPTKGHIWEPQPSEWDELFVPSQPPVEIENAILNALKAY